MSRLTHSMAFVVGIFFILLMPSPTQAMSNSLETLIEPTDTRTTLAPNVGYMFDLIAFDTLQVTSFDINIANTGTYNFRIYTKFGTYIGSETNAGAWSLLGSANATGANVGNLVNLPVGGLIIPAGQTYGVYIVVDNVIPALIPTLGAGIYGNANIRIEAGSELSEVSSAQFFGSGGIIPNRTLNMRVNYDSPPMLPPVSQVPSFVVPNLSEVLMTTAQAQPAFMSPAGQIIRNADTSALMLPNDADGNGFDTYLITEVRVIDDETWLALFIGSARWVWVPLGDLQILRPLFD